MSALRRTTLFLLAGFAFIPLQATAWDRGKAELFATLPDGVRFPEGITANPASGDIFVGTFDVGTPNNQLLRFDRQGRLEASRAFGTTPLLGLEFDRNRRQVYIAAVGDFSGTGSRIQRIAANFKEDTKIEEVALIPAIGAPRARRVENPDGSFDTITFGDNARVPNALTFDRAGNLYVSDSFQGAIFRIENPAKCAPGCVATMVVHDPLLATAGFPPFGANGIAFNRDESALFIANTGDDRVLKLDMHVAHGDGFRRKHQRGGRLGVRRARRAVGRRQPGRRAGGAERRRSRRRQARRLRGNSEKRIARRPVVSGEHRHPGR